MKKAVSLLLVAVTFFFSSCEKYDHAIGDLNDRLNHIEGLVISTLGQQIAGINGSLDDLKGVDAALQQLIDDLTDKVDELQKQFDDKQSNDSTTANLKLLEEINNLRSLIEALQAKSIEFEGQIAKLKNYVDSEISDIENWSNGTFATLEQYAAMQTEIAAIKALLEHNNSDIIGECTKAITEAIGTCEATMKKWVNEQLASGYYDIAAIDAKLAALESKLAGADDELKKEIEDQQAALEQAKAELTAAYKQAITEAIDTNNGVINKAIADAVQEALDKVDTKLAVIDNAIAAIQRDIETIKSSIATLEQQIAGINGSLVELEAVDAALQQLIDGLEGEVATLQSQIDSNTAADAATKVQLEKEITDLKNLIATLQAKDADLEAQITALKSYVDSEITGIESWANGTFATLAQYAAMQSELAALKALVGDGNTGNIEEFTRAIAASEASMKGWVNQLLASGYYDIAAIDAKLAALESKLTGADDELKKDIEGQQAALEQAKAELTAAYKQAITEAIDTNNGVINKAIADAVQEALDKVDTKLAVIDNAIAAIQRDIETIKSSIATLEQQIAGINGSLVELEAVDAALQQLIDGLEGEVATLQSQIDSNTAADAATKVQLEKEITDLKNLIATLQAKDADLEAQITALKNYVDSEITGIESWANGTFATLAQYAAMQSELAALKALVGDGNTGNIEEFTRAISDAIAASEASMKGWVNQLLASGYYDIAAIDAKLAALESKLTGADDELKKDIEDQQAALEQAKAELTAAYKQAITEAIEANNGVINKAISDAVQEALDKVDTKLAVIDNAIAAIQRDIETIKSSIATLEQQIAGINGSLVELEAVDAALQQLIDGLEGEVATLQSQIDSNTAADAATKVQLEKEITDLKNLIATLQAKDADLEAQITALKSYVDSEITGIESWANGTFATLAQYAAMQSELAALKALVGDGNTGNIEEFTRAIAASEASMKGWVNQLLASSYYDIAAIDAKLATLESKLTTTETQLRKDIEQQQTALEQAKVELTAAYQQAITEAIDNNNGVITTAIEQAVQTAKADLQNQINAINSAIANLQTQIDKIANRIQSITYIPQYSDGKVKFDYTTKTTEVYLRLSPAALAADIETSMVKAFVRYTDDPTTRALNEEFPVTVSVVAGNATSGILHVCLAEDANHPFADSFWKGDVEAILYLLISDGNSNIVSPSIPVITHSYVSGSSDIDGFGDGQSSEGTVQ